MQMCMYDEIAAEGNYVYGTRARTHKFAVCCCMRSCNLNYSTTGVRNPKVLWSHLAVSPKTFLDAINDAEDNNDDEKIESLLCGSVKYLKMNRAKPEAAMFLSLMYLAKARPTFFGSEVVIEVQQFSSAIKLV